MPGSISTERWRRLQAVLDDALDLPPAAVAPYLDRACLGDAELRAEAERMLASTRAAERFLEEPPARLAAELLAELPVPAGRRVGSYEIVGELGRGGMGVVYLAERADGQFRQRVALKVVPRGLDTPHAVRRFLEERQILATLTHPGIARLLDGGVTEDGVPYFAMEHVEGTPLDRSCDERRLDVAARLRLFRAVCDAVQYAHQNLVVHRDLKPSNILVTEDGVVKLLDFGIAKLLSGAPDPATVTGARWLTPRYASPEQVRGAPVSTVSDVYTLGVLLYELLAGRPPYPLADDVRRHLDGRPVRARPDTLGYRASRFVRRHRAAVAVFRGARRVARRRRPRHRVAGRGRAARERDEAPFPSSRAGAAPFPSSRAGAAPFPSSRAGEAERGISMHHIGSRHRDPSLRSG